jgi:hypothetical protein
MNAHVFSILKDNVQPMSDKVGVCCIMFDEMSIRRLTALKALRMLQAMAGLAILQIMTWSLCSLAFYLICRSTKCEMLVVFLKEVLDTCQNAGLVFVATMLDMGANNVKDF